MGQDLKEIVVTMRVTRRLHEAMREAAEHEAVGISTLVRMAVKARVDKVLKEKRRAA